ncbi:prolyl oligopeptidase family serine peptidase [Bdellovibrio sp. NC01]|uniref:extracellular medium-chain-length polyhydroxyalkanoate depolymerase n=1 Tax=Bdellovibrio sp. NC01 TaxID=2220073 RepID=UPI00115A5ABF|nr:prolyl oligopeptidase family serine peptidase [Bdellovibrio sp. NC01]QDK39412.1 dipeptidyl aminopeptidase [Bdellovibrio sp. NC01]
MKLATLISIILLTSFAQAAKKSMCESGGIIVKHIACPFQEKEIKGALLTRDVKYSLPEGPMPQDGWPTVVIFQGSFFSVEFERSQGMPFGGFNEIRLIQSLLDHGFAVVAPNAISNLAWETNLIGVTWEGSEDDVFLHALFNSMSAGEFGPLNMNKLFATGISSGGYNTSRMAVSFPGMFKALAIESGSYASCGGPLCDIPELPVDHPPTMFLHGDNDYIVPISTMKKYYEKLKDNGVKTAVVIDPHAGHEWLDKAPEAVTKWFMKFKR